MNVVIHEDCVMFDSTRFPIELDENGGRKVVGALTEKQWQAFVEEKERAGDHITSRTIIQCNGSRWAGSPPAAIEELIEVLGKEPLDPTFELYGNFICLLDVNWRGQPHPYAGMWQFGGNFALLSHVFGIVTSDPEVIEQLTKAIRDNQATKAYKDAKAEWGKDGVMHRGIKRYPKPAPQYELGEYVCPDCNTVLAMNQDPCPVCKCANKKNHIEFKLGRDKCPKCHCWVGDAERRKKEVQIG